MVKSDEAIAQARHLVEAVEHSYSDKLVTTMLKLEVLSMEKEPQPVEYYDGKRACFIFICIVSANPSSCDSHDSHHHADPFELQDVCC